jgi:hypothetical protein
LRSGVRVLPRPARGADVSDVGSGALGVRAAAMVGAGSRDAPLVGAATDDRAELTAGAESAPVTVGVGAPVVIGFAAGASTAAVSGAVSRDRTGAPAVELRGPAGPCDVRAGGFALLLVESETGTRFRATAVPRKRAPGAPALWTAEPPAADGSMVSRVPRGASLMSGSAPPAAEVLAGVRFRATACPRTRAVAVAVAGASVAGPAVAGRSVPSGPGSGAAAFGGPPIASKIRRAALGSCEALGAGIASSLSPAPGVDLLGCARETTREVTEGTSPGGVDRLSAGD